LGQTDGRISDGTGRHAGFISHGAAVPEAIAQIGASVASTGIGRRVPVAVIQDADLGRGTATRSAGV